MLSPNSTENAFIKAINAVHDPNQWSLLCSYCNCLTEIFGAVDYFLLQLLLGFPAPIPGFPAYALNLEWKLDLKIRA